jgi:hypothetical protein
MRKKNKLLQRLCWKVLCRVRCARTRAEATWQLVSDSIRQPPIPECWHTAPVWAAPVSMTGSAQLTALGRHYVSAIEPMDSAESLTCYGNTGGQRAIQTGLMLTGTY